MSVQNGNHIKVANKSFENVTEVKYLGTTVTNKNCIHEELKKQIKFGGRGGG
jgi:hypothetical protein